MHCGRSVGFHSTMLLYGSLWRTNIFLVLQAACISRVYCSAYSFRSVGLAERKRRNICNLPACRFKQVKHICPIRHLVLRFRSCFGVFYVPKPVLIMRHAVVGDSGNLDHLGFFNVHLNLSTRVFSHFAPIEMRPPWPGFDPATSCSAAQHKILAPRGGPTRSMWLDDFRGEAPYSGTRSSPSS